MRVTRGPIGDYHSLRLDRCQRPDRGEENEEKAREEGRRRRREASGHLVRLASSGAEIEAGGLQRGWPLKKRRTRSTLGRDEKLEKEAMKEVEQERERAEKKSRPHRKWRWKVEVNCQSENSKQHERKWNSALGGERLKQTHGHD